MKRNRMLAACGVLCLLGAPAMSQTTDIAPLKTNIVPFQADSGWVWNDEPGMQVVYSTVITVPGASWIRLSFDEVVLSGDPQRGTGSILRITSMHDGHQQRLNREHVRQWNNTSAYFNGDTVILDLLAHERTGRNRVRITEVMAGEPAQHPESICGPTDDRTLSNDPRQGRLVPIGCTAWMIDDPNHCFLTAGHCISNGSTNSVVEFNVPLSNSNGSIVHPPPEDQYMADPVSIQSNGGQGVGNDYAYFGCFPNPNTGKTPFEAQGDYYTLAAVAPPVSGQQIRITGYGVVSSPVPLTWSQVQKTHVGPYFALVGTNVQYQVDTTGGNSGSPVVDESTGLAIGIHTHAGCNSTGTGANNGTAIHHTGLQGYLANPKGVCIPQGLKFSYPLGLPVLLDPAGGTTVRVEVLANAGLTPDPGTGMVHYDFGAGWQSAPMTQITSNVYDAVLPAISCGTVGKFYFSAMDTTGATHVDPTGAPNKFYSAPAGTGISTTVLVDESFESGLPAGWVASGLWHVTASCSPGTPCDGSTMFAYYGLDTTCTYNNGSSNSGSLSIPPVDLTGVPSGLTVTLEFCYNLETEDLSPYDAAEVVVNGQPLIELGESASWQTMSVDLSAYAGTMANIEFRFDTVDGLFNDWRGWQVDGVRVVVEQLQCVSCYADCDGNGSLDLFDFLCFTNEFNAGDPYADCDGNGSLDLFDFLCFTNEFNAGCP